MSKIGLLGCGTVGTGVYEIINEKKGNFFEQDDYTIKKILVRDTSKEREGIPSELLTRADWAMYNSKKNGCDKITIDSDQIEAMM